MSTPTQEGTPTPDDGNDAFAAITSQLSDLAGLDSPQADPVPVEPIKEQAEDPEPAATATTVDPSGGPDLDSVESVPVEQAMARDGWAKPAGPKDRHELAVTFPLRHAIKIGFAMTVIAAAIGQTLFFAGFFGEGIAGYGLAVGIAAFAEVTMIGSGDSALRHKVERNSGWQLLLAVSAAVAAGATTMQVAHWVSDGKPVMALTFGAASLLGWVVHIASGLIAANGHLARENAYTAELERRRQKQEAAEDAARARAESAPTPASVSASAPTSAATSTPASAPKPASKPKSKPKSKPTPASVVSELRPETARQWSDNHDGATASQVRAHFQEQGYRVPDVRTVRRWLNQRPQ